MYAQGHADLHVWLILIELKNDGAHRDAANCSDATARPGCDVDTLDHSTPHTDYYIMTISNFICTRHTETL